MYAEKRKGWAKKPELPLWEAVLTPSDGEIAYLVTDVMPSNRYGAWHLSGEDAYKIHRYYRPEEGQDHYLIFLRAVDELGAFARANHIASEMDFGQRRAAC